jgi:hypothetical protein
MTLQMLNAVVAGATVVAVALSAPPAASATEVPPNAPDPTAASTTARTALTSTTICRTTSAEVAGGRVLLVSVAELMSWTVVAPPVDFS